MKRKVLSIIVCSFLAICLTACGSSTSTYSESAKASSYASYDAEDSYAEVPYAEEAMVEADYLSDGSNGTGVDTTTTENASTSNRKLIRTVGINAETKEFDELVNNVTKKIQELGGYVENMDSFYGSKYNSVKSSKNATITARVPAKNLDAFLNMMGEAANITNKTENVEDVTLSYVDMASHKKMLEEERDRLLAFLDEATSIEEIITIEDRLSTVKYQIESMEAQLRTYDNKVDYSTVRISITEVVDYTEIKEPEPEKSAWERMTEGFVENFGNVIDGLKEFGIWFVINIPYLIIWAIFITIFVIVFKKVLKKYRANEEKRAEEKRARIAGNHLMPPIGKPLQGQPAPVPGQPMQVQQTVNPSNEAEQKNDDTNDNKTDSQVGK
ncbi:MAG: DUF4349 domain-containing protein [Lachnospiraceae bacterium]|nr:DUF4349 domain-containing protein [Candidatus Colinaster scatohippi]